MGSRLKKEEYEWEVEIKLLKNEMEKGSFKRGCKGAQGKGRRSIPRPIGNNPLCCHRPCLVNYLDLQLDSRLLSTTSGFH